MSQLANQQPTGQGAQPTPGSMPSRSSSSAPKFDGTPQSLQRFLDEVRDLVDEKHVTDRAAIKAALSYIPSADYPLWTALDAVSNAGSTWKEFVDAVYAIYPGTASKDRQYTKTDLTLLIKRTQSATMQNHDDFGRYYRSFFAITSFLTKKGRMGPADQSEKLVEGLPPNLQKELREYLRATDPSHHADDPWPMNTLYEAILFVLSNTNTTGTLGAHLADTDRVTKPAIKTETFDATTLDKYFGSDAFMGKMSAFMLRSQGKSAAAPSPPSQANTSTPYSPNPGPPVCLFCSETGHFIRECPVAHQYIKEGRCAKNDEGKMILPGNIYVSGRMPGRNMKERIDYWHHTNSAAATSSPSATGFLLQLASEPSPANRDPHDEISAIESNIELQHARIAALKLEAYGPTTRTRSYGNNDPAPAKDTPPKDTPPHMPATTTAPAPAANNAKTSSPSHTTMISDPKTSAPITSALTPSQPSRALPQFSYQAPIEDANAVADILERSLNTEVKVTNRQLLAMSSDLRKAFREQTTTKRIVNNLMAISNEGIPSVSTRSTVSSLFAAIAERTDGVVVADHKVDLRTITVGIPGVEEVEAVLDEGCQIIAVSKKVWEKSGLPLRSDHVMSMESANAQTNDTLGLLPDLPVTIGGHTFYVQCQVIDNAPYQMLMGRPFMTFTQASTRHFLNGDSHITLVDPNTQAVLTIPTHTRDREAEEKSF